MLGQHLKSDSTAHSAVTRTAADIAAVAAISAGVMWRGQAGNIVFLQECKGSKATAGNPKANC